MLDKGTGGRVQGGQGNGRKDVCISLMSSMEQYPKVRGVANRAPWCECRLNSEPPYCTCETFRGGGRGEGGGREGEGGGERGREGERGGRAEVVDFYLQMAKVLNRWSCIVLSVPC
jgi:hypothetical protein